MSTDMVSDYNTFLYRKHQLGGLHGFEPQRLPAALFDFQQSLTAWALRKGRAAIFADCGLGKTLCQLAWAHAVAARRGTPVLILTPLAVGAQTVREGEKFELPCVRSRDGRWGGHPQVIVTNYEQLAKFSPSDFGGVVCDESSILKHFSGATQKQVTRFMAKVPARLLCTATPSPNDYIELGCASEALGALGYSDMLSRFFIMDDDKRYRMNEVKLYRDAPDVASGHLMPESHDYYAKLAYRVAQQVGRWRLKGHAEQPFWRWVASWALACRTPSDLGFSDEAFRLPTLTERQHVIEPKHPAQGMLFTVPAFGLKEEREERRRTLDERCHFAADLVDHAAPAVVWCQYNAEGDRLAQLIPGSVQVKGPDSDEKKERAYEAFASGEIRVMITKPVIGAWGLNWQHCAHVVTFASHSYEQYYQAVRRCWRFGQTHPVTVDVIATTGERRVMDNMRRKAHQAAQMFDALIAEMSHATSLSDHRSSTPTEVPSWLSTIA